MRFKVISVSNAFKTAIKANDRQFRPRLTITWTDALIDPTIAVTSNDDNYVHPLSDKQAADGITISSQKWAHLDGVLVPDGTYYPAPDDAQATAGAQFGWYGATRCSAGKTWSAPYPTLSVTFAERPALSLMVSGDSVYNEYPADFDIEIYAAGDVLLYTETVTGNALLSWSKSIASEEINTAVRMDLIIKKWSTANRVAKILEFYTPISDVYEGADIVSMNLLEEREVADGSLPIGNISANELDIELQNIKLVRGAASIVDPFSFENSDSYLENLLKKNRRIYAELGLVLPDTSVEYVPLGTFWSGDWKATEKGTVVTTSARDRMELLRNSEFSTSLIYAGVNLYDLMEVVLNAAKTNIPMPDLEWDIDDELEDYTVPIAYFPRQDYFKCIKQIVEVCMGQAYMSRDDVLTVTGPSFAGIGATPYSITRDDYFDRSQPSKSEELKNFVRVPITALTVQDNTSELYRSDPAITVPAGGTFTVDADYTNYPATIAFSTLEDVGAGITIQSETFYGCSAHIVLANSSGSPATVVLVISGVVYDTKSDEFVEDSDAASILENGKCKYEFPVNHLLQTRTIGAAIAAKLLLCYKTWRKDTNLQWRGNPAIELGDIIEVPQYQYPHQAPYSVDSKGNFYVYKNKLDFDGTLKAVTDGRKIL
jgi:hypothetical protein